MNRVSTTQLQSAVKAAEARAYRTSLALASSRAAQSAEDFQPINDALTEISDLGPANDDILQLKAGEWTNRTPAQVRSDMGLAAAPVWVTPPAAISSTGTAGQAAYETGWFYVCVATDTWRRVALGTW